MDENERRLIQAGERIALYEDAARIVAGRLARAKAEYARLGGDFATSPSMSREIDRAIKQFSVTPFTLRAFVTVETLSEISEKNGWFGVRGQVMRQLGFREAQPYLMGVRTRVWVRGNAPPRGIQFLTEYRGRPREDGRMDVIIRGGDPQIAAPPLPY